MKFQSSKKLANWASFVVSVKNGPRREDKTISINNKTYSLRGYLVYIIPLLAQFVSLPYL